MRSYEQSKRLGEHEDENEKENISFSSSFFDTTTTKERGGGDVSFRKAKADELRIHHTEIIGYALCAESPHHFPSRIFYPNFDVSPTNYAPT